MAKTGRIQAVVFDLDDTLYAERDYVRSGYEAVAKHLAGRGAHGEKMGPWLWRRFLAGQHDGALDALNEHFRLGLSIEEIGDLLRVYREHTPRIRPYGAVPDTLRRMRKHVALGLLTDGFLPAQQLKLEALRLKSHFRAVVFTEHLGRSKWKPAPDGYELITRQLGVAHEACCYVADNPAKDFVAPNGLGWLTVQLRWPEQIHADNPAPRGGQPQAVVRSLGELWAAVQ